MKRQLSKGLHLLSAKNRRIDAALLVIGIACLIATAIGVLIIGS